eukprot:504766-Pelagomonas_calceolata.AAC.1
MLVRAVPGVAMLGDITTGRVLPIELKYTSCKEFGEKLSQWIPEETTVSLIPTKLGLLLLLHAMLAKPMYPCLDVLAIKLKIKHILFLTVLMNKIVVCAASTKMFTSTVDEASQECTLNKACAKNIPGRRFLPVPLPRHRHIALHEGFQ